MSSITKRVSYVWPRAVLYATTGMTLAHVVLQPSHRVVVAGRVLWLVAALWTIGAVVWNAWVATKEAQP